MVKKSKKEVSASLSSLPVTKNHVIAGIVVIGILVLGFLGWQYFKQQGIVAEVNDMPITEEDVALELKTLPAAPLAESSTDITNAAVERIARKKLLLAEAGKQGITKTEGEVDREVHEFLLTNQITKEEFLQQLAKKNVTFEQFRSVVRTQLLINELLTKTIVPRVAISSEEVSAFYAKNNESLQQIQLSHVLICFADKQRCTSNKTKETALMEAQKALAEIRSGADFYTVSQRYSDSQTAREKGKLGYFFKGTMVKSVEEAAFKMRVNTTSDIIESEYGFHILKLEGKLESYDDLKDLIAEQLTQYKTRTLSEQYVQQLVDSATIEYTE